jgi:hypothetical protein
MKHSCFNLSRRADATGIDAAFVLAFLIRLVVGLEALLRRLSLTCARRLGDRVL